MPLQWGDSSCHQKSTRQPLYWPFQTVRPICVLWYTYQSAAELSFLWMSFPLNGLSITRCCMVMLLKCPPSNLLYTSGVEQTIPHKRVFCCCKAWPWKEANRNPRRYRYLSRQRMYPMGGETSAGEDSRMRLGKEFRAVSGSSKVQAWGAKAERDGRW